MRADLVRHALPPGRGACDFPKCGKLAWSRRLCRGHYEQQRTGRPLTKLMTRAATALNALATRYKKDRAAAIAAGTPCPRDGLRGSHVCVGRADNYARSGEAAGG